MLTRQLLTRRANKSGWCLTKSHSAEPSKEAVQMATRTSALNERPCTASRREPSERPMAAHLGNRISAARHRAHRFPVRIPDRRTHGDGQRDQSITKTILDHRTLTSLPNGSTMWNLGVDGYGEVISRGDTKTRILGLTFGDKDIQLKAAASLSLPLARRPDERSASAGRTSAWTCTARCSAVRPRASVIDRPGSSMACPPSMTCSNGSPARRPPQSTID